MDFLHAPRAGSSDNDFYHQPLRNSGPQEPETMIDCIAIPTTPHEIKDLAVLLACWEIYHSGSLLADRLVITLPGSEVDQIRTDIDKLISLFNTKALFNAVDLIFLAIPKEEDIYIKEKVGFKGVIPKMGLKSGPNLQFFRTIQATRESKYTFLNETDVLPLTPSWLQDLSATLRPDHDWVLGSNYKGETILGADIVSHINGAAVYNTGSEAFQDFCDIYWGPGVEDMCRELPDTAYDIWLSRLQHQFSTSPSAWNNGDPRFRKAIADAISRFTVTNKIANLTLPNDFKPLAELEEQGFCLVHGKHFSVPALTHAIEHARLGMGCQLLKHQYLSIVSRHKCSPEIIASLEAVMPKRSVELARKLLSSKKARNSSNKSNKINHTSILEYSKDSSELPALDCVQPIKLFPKLSDVCIFTRSYIGDARLLPEMYASVDKNFSSASECVLVVEENDFDAIKSVVPEWVKIRTEKSFAPGTIQHKYSKLTADRHTDCEWIFHLDSDTLVSSPISLDYLLSDGKPIIETASYESLRNHQDSAIFIEQMRTYVLKNHLPNELHKEGVIDTMNWIETHFDHWFQEWYPKWKYAFGLDVWQEGTSYAFGSNVDLEFSQKPIKLYPKEIYTVCRAHIERIHKRSLEEFIQTRIGRQAYEVNRKDYFSDLNFIGVCLYYYANSSVRWVRTDIEGYDWRPTYFNQRISYDILNDTT